MRFGTHKADGKEPAGAAVRRDVVPRDTGSVCPRPAQRGEGPALSSRCPALSRGASRVDLSPLARGEVKKRLRWGALLILITSALAAEAHPFALSGFEAHTEGRDVRFEMALDLTSVLDLVEWVRPEKARPSLAALPDESALVFDYFAGRFQVRNTDLPCPLIRPTALAVDEPAGKVRFTARFRCPRELGLLVIDSSLFAEETTPHDLIGNFHHARAFERYFLSKTTRQVRIDVPALRQVMPAEIDKTGGFRSAEPPPGAFDQRAQHAIRGVPVAPQGAASGAGFALFVRRGIEHIIGGLDHVLFLLLLVLAAPGLQQVVLVVLGFTAAHGLTLIAGAYGLITVSPRLAEPLIALSLVYVAAVNLRARARAQRVGLEVALLFGAVHGLGFVGALAALGFAAGTAGAGAVTAFNLGAFAGQLLVVVPGAWLVQRLRTRPALSLPLERALNVLVGLVACGWFIARLRG
jgi:HupE / UreJ protein